MTAEVNWDESVSPCKQVRFTFEDKSEVVEIKDLYSLLMLFGDDVMQDKLIQVKETEMVLIERMLHVRMKKNVSAGELITFPYQYAITKEGYEELVKNNPRQYRIVKELPKADLSTSTKTDETIQEKPE